MARATAGATQVRDVLRTGLRDVARLVLPVQCPGCGALDVPLCAACRVVLLGPARRCEADVPRLDRMDAHPALPVWTAAAYTGSTRGVVVAWKDRGRVDLTPVLVGAVRCLAREVAPVLAAAVGTDELHVVPVPSTPGARRRRGADLVALLAAGVVAGLVDAAVPAARAPVLARRRGVRDQVGLGARARGANAAGSLRPRGSGARPGCWYLLVDDVVTTGSTLAGCEAAVSASGGLVLGALVLAATPPPPRRAGRLLVDGGED